LVEGGTILENNDEIIAFTTRLPRSLVAQVDARRKLNKRTRNSEIHFLVEAGIQAGVDRDRQLMESFLKKDPQ
jgi:hypothetical protein